MSSLYTAENMSLPLIKYDLSSTCPRIVHSLSAGKFLRMLTLFGGNLNAVYTPPPPPHAGD